MISDRAFEAIFVVAIILSLSIGLFVGALTDGKGHTHYHTHMDVYAVWFDLVELETGQPVALFQNEAEAIEHIAYMSELIGEPIEAFALVESHIFIDSQETPVNGSKLLYRPD